MHQEFPTPEDVTSAPPRRKQGNWLISPQGVMRIAILAALFPVMGCFGSHYWVLDLCNHPQAQYFCFLLAASLILTAWRKYRYALFCLALLSIPVVKLAPLYLPRKACVSPSIITAATYNILGSNTRYAASTEWILKQHPDFIYLPETNEEWGVGLKPLAEKYPYAVDVFIEGNFGSSFRSKFPIIRHEVHHAGALALPLLEMVVKTPHGELTVFGAHPVPPVTAFWANERDTYLAMLCELAAHRDGHLIILGDLNATRWSSAMQSFWDHGLRDSADGHGFSATWNRENPLMAIPIDHILTRGFSGVPGRETGPALGSDHRPVLAELAW